MALALTTLVIALKQAPENGWTSGLVVGLLALSLTSASGFVRRTLSAPVPVVDLRTFGDRRFAIGCVLSFVLGIGLFGSIYLMPVFLAFVRGRNALEIGTVILVTGAAQLVMAPVAVALEHQANARLLTAAGFGVFALGLGMSAFATPERTLPACSGRRSFVGSPSCSVSCLPPASPSGIWIPIAFRTPAACSI